MIVTDLFSHKIHSSGDEWSQKLIEIASVFSQFDGLPYDRTAIEDAFKKISPRASIIARDPSKYRDEISAYPAYLGLFRIEEDNGILVLKLSEAAKRFLIVEEPNVSAFMITQLTLFQYPNGNGASYANGSIRLQRNAADRTLEFIRSGMHLSPFRLICKALLADSMLNGIDSLHPRVSINEISVLCNDPLINKDASPDLERVLITLKDIRESQIPSVPKFERRFHLLNHTDLVQVTNGWLHLREAISPADSERIINLLKTIAGISIQFNEFDSVQDYHQLAAEVKSGAWSRYFDGATQLPIKIMQEIAGDYNTDSIPIVNQSLDGEELVDDYKKVVFRYPLQERGEDNSLSERANEYKVRAQADPEVTRIKRQKSNLSHKILLSKLDEHLRYIGARPMENEHIDLYAEVPNNGSYLFEVKSTTTENLLSQTRKGLSQLYEYRFRYAEDLKKDVLLCLVYPKEPSEIDWLQQYLAEDRDIGIAWFDGDKLCFSQRCVDKFKSIVIN